MAARTGAAPGRRVAERGTDIGPAVERVAEAECDVGQAGAAADVSATLSYQCQTFGLSLLANAAVRLCLSIGDGAQGDGGITPRRMLSGASALQFNLYSDASRTQVWGTYPGNHVDLVSDTLGRRATA